MDIWFSLGVGLSVVAVLGGLGAAVRFGKAYWLMAGYNTMPAERRRDVDSEGLGRFVGNCLFAACGFVAAATAFFALGIWQGGVAVLILLLPGLVWMLARAQRFDRRAVTPAGKLTGPARAMIAFVIVILAGTGAGVALLLQKSAAPAEYAVASGKLEIRCLFGESVSLDGVEGLALAGSLPAIEARTNGAALGGILRGSFRLAGGIPARIFTENGDPPFVTFRSGGTAYYINRKIAEQTRALFGELSDAVRK